MKAYLFKDLEFSARKRGISIGELIDQILSTAMLHEKFLTEEDDKAILKIYKKYMVVDAYHKRNGG